MWTNIFLGVVFPLTVSVRERSACQRRHSHSFLPKMKSFFFFPGNEGSFKTDSNFYDFLGGTAGVFTYRIPVIQKSLAVMWTSNPVVNCAWNVKLYDNYPSPDEDMYRELARDRFPGDSSTHKRLIGGGLKVSGLMTCGNNSVLRITVLKDGKAWGHVNQYTCITSSHNRC